MSTSAVLVHFDVHGLVAPHVLRYAESLANFADRLTIVSAAGLTNDGRTALGVFGNVIERENRGYDFMSWKLALGSDRSWMSDDLLILANDSVVGPLVDLPEVVAKVTSGRADLVGANVSRQYTPHAQSFFMAAGPTVLRSSIFDLFWKSVEVRPSRNDVIFAYELGLSRLLASAGFRVGGFFEESPTDVLDAWFREQTALARGRHTSPPTRDELKARIDAGDVSYRSPAMWLWDRALTTPAQMAFVKLQTLRNDPARATKVDAMTACERAYPEAFAGVREYVKRTDMLHAMYRSG